MIPIYLLLVYLNVFGNHRGPGLITGKGVKKGIYNLKHGDYEYPITYQLIKDGKKNKVLIKKIKSNISICMIHGKKDEVIPYEHSLKLFKKALNPKKHVCVDEAMHNNLYDFNIDKEVIKFNSLI